MTTLITGSTGWLGRSVVKNFDRPITVSTSATDTGERHFPCDISDTRQMEGLAETLLTRNHTIDTVIHCAGLAHNETRQDSDFFSINSEGTKNVVKLCRLMSASRILYVSTIASYDWTLNKVPCKEDSIINPQNAYSQSKLEGENHVATSNLDWRICRLATVFGSEDPANFKKLAQALKEKKFIVPGKGLAKKSVIPIDLAASLIAQYSELDSPTHRLINLALPAAPTLTEICNAFCDSCHFPKSYRLPMGLLKMIGKAGDLAETIRPAPFNTKVLKKLTTSTWVDTTRLEQTFPNIEFEDFNTSLKRHKDYYS